MEDRELKTIPVEITAGKKETYLLDFDFKTIECDNDPTDNGHEITILSVADNYELNIDASSKAEHKVKAKEKETVKTSLSTSTSVMGVKNKSKDIVKEENGIVTVRQKQIEFDAFYNYDIPQDANPVTTFVKAMQYYGLRDLSEAKINRINAFTTTCAFRQNIHIAVYPDIKWTLKFGFNVTKNDIEKLNKNGGTFAPLKTYEAQALEKEKAYFEKNESRKETLDRAEKYFTEKYDLKHKETPDAPVDKGTKFKQIIEILKRITISLEEQHYGGDIKNELTDNFVKQFYEQLRPVILLAGKAVGIVEGDYDKKDFTPKEEKDIEGLMARLNRKPVEYEMLYPKLSGAGSWYYEEIDRNQYPELAGRQGVGINLVVKAAPLIGMSIKWDILELLCRRHPIAYAVLKAVQGLFYILADDPSAIKCDFIVSGQIDTAVDLKHNYLAGFKEISVKGGNSIKIEIILELKLNNSIKVGKFEVLVKRGVSSGISIGLGIEDVYGIDVNGIYLKRDLVFEGIKFSFKAEGSVELSNKECKRKKSMFKLGGEVSEEITMLAHAFSTEKMYIIKHHKS